MQKKKNAAKGVAAKILGSGVLTWVLLLAIWKAGSLFYPPEFLPGPLETWKGAFSLISDGTLAGDVWVSLGRVLKGWVLGVVFAVPVGLCVGCFPWAGRIFEPFLNFFRFVPAIGFITLFLLWFGVGETSKVALIFYAVIFPVMVNTIAGVRSVDTALLEAAESLGARRAKIFFYRHSPFGSAPYFYRYPSGTGKRYYLYCSSRNAGSFGRGGLFDLYIPFVLPHRLDFYGDFHPGAHGIGCG